jgi:hypothetical protein
MHNFSLNFNDIINITKNINLDLEEKKWCFTGSVALYIYCNIYNINYNLLPNDLDIVYVPDSLIDEKPFTISGFNRFRDNNTNNGLPYYDILTKRKMIDLICREKIEYLELEIENTKFNLLLPELLLNLYIERLDENLDCHITKTKIDILKKILFLCENNTQNIAKHVYITEKEKNLDLSENIRQPNFFDDE